MSGRRWLSNDLVGGESGAATAIDLWCPHDLKRALGFLSLAVLGTVIGSAWDSANAAPTIFHNELAERDQAGCSPTGPQGVENAAHFASWLGRRPDRIVEFSWNKNWDVMVNSTRSLSKCWHDAGHPKLTYTFAMLPTSAGVSLADGAAGKYDNYLREMGAALIQNGYGDAVIRLGHEFNFPHSPWTAGNDPAHFVLYWRHIVDVLRSLPGANFSFDWCPALYPTPLDLLTAYPGDAYVDIVGLDVYNRRGWHWARDYVNAKFGLKWQRDFAIAHRKQISFPEWGTGSQPNGEGGGDDPAFVNHMAHWIAANNVAYQGYWNEHARDYDANLSDGQQPAAAAAYKRDFGSQAAH